MKARIIWQVALCVGIVACGDNANHSSRSADSTDKASNNSGGSSSKPELELVFSDSMYQFTGIAKEPGGRLFINYPRWSPVYKYAAVVGDGMSKTPYPDEAMNAWQPGQDGKNKWVCVQSTFVDDNGGIWVLDPAAPMLKKIQGSGAKLVKMTKNNKVEKNYSFMGIVPDSAYVNDVRIDTKNNYAYLTESKRGGIIVIDLGSGKMRLLLSTHPSVKSDPAYKFIIDGHELIKEGKPAKFNSDGIALTPDAGWLYYKPLTDDKLYRIKTEFLRDWNMPDTAMQANVEDLGHFCSADGMIFGKSGTLYFGDPQNYRIVKVDKDHKLTTIIQDQRLIWPDSYAIADGYLYITCSQINLQPEYNNGVNKRTTPYTVYRLKIDE